MAEGRVTTGYSKPYVALYSASAGTISYTSGTALGRGVSVTINPESSADNDFYANNQIAESEDGKFTGGTVDLEIDGLLAATRKLIFGLPTAGTDGWTEFNDDMAIPDVGIGWIARGQSDGVVTYRPTVLYKCKFQLPSNSATTQGESIDWQTETLTATIMRADDAKHGWKSEGNDYATEAEAEAALKTKLGI